jgi:UDP-glucose 4-epimerase
LRLPIQGDGSETRAFAHVDDAVDGLLCLVERAEHLAIYNVGTDTETRIGDLASRIGRVLGRDVEVLPGPAPAGATRRRCPDISKIRALGFRPRVALDEGLASTVRWYDEHADQRP